MNKYEPTCVEVCDNRLCLTSVLTNVHVRVSASQCVVATFILTQIQHMDISKAGVAIASTVNNHLVADEVGGVVSLLVGHITAGSPFLPGQAVLVTNVQGPDVIQCSLTVAATKDDQVVAVQHGGMGSTRRWELATRRSDGRTAPTMSGRVKHPHIVRVGWPVASTKEVQLVTNQGRGVCSNGGKGFTVRFNRNPLQRLRVKVGDSTPA
jgi:hypothetical protein